MEETRCRQTTQFDIISAKTSNEILVLCVLNRIWISHHSKELKFGLLERQNREGITGSPMFFQHTEWSVAIFGYVRVATSVTVIMQD